MTAPRFRLGWRVLVWPALWLVPLALPLPATTFGLLAQAAAAFVLLLSLGLLWGRVGLLSFGQALYSGLGAYAAAHAMNAVARHHLPLPFALVPLLAGGFAAAAAMLFGPISVRRGGIAFAMITLGIGVLVAQLAPMLQGFFCGEGGIATDRTAGPVWLGLDLLSQRQVYGVSAAYALLAIGCLRWIDSTRLGLLARAVRDNPLRVAAGGYAPRGVRLRMVLLAAALAGVAGGLQTLHFEQVSASGLGLQQSGNALLFSLAGGAGSAWGALLGAGLMVGSEAALAQWSRAWLLYVGLGFLAIVIRAPQGLAGVGSDLSRRLRDRGDPDLIWGLVAALLCAVAALIGGSSLVELVYARRQQLLAGPSLKLYGVAVASASPAVWAGAALLALTGASLLAAIWQRLRRQLGDVDGDAP